jgi:heme-degrading monooxygenase HmoA
MFLSDSRSELASIVREHRELASRWEGYVSLKCLRPAQNAPSDRNDVVLLLEFQTEAQLSDWRSSAEHARIASRYQALWSRPPVVEFFLTVDEE